MNDKQTEQHHTELDKTLTQRFQTLRTENKKRLPDFPTEARLQQRQALHRQQAPEWITQIPRIAAGFALIAITALLISNLDKQVTEDPAAIYADIMQAHYGMSTDELLVVSGSLSPEMAESPDFYNIDLDIEFYSKFDSELYTN